MNPRLFVRTWDACGPALKGWPCRNRLAASPGVLAGASIHRAGAGLRRRAWVVLVLLHGVSILAATPRIDFNRQIRPILSENCFPCHGPDERTRKAKLRLDRAEDAYRPVLGGRLAIKPGDPSASELVRRILTMDADDRMPPLESKLALSAEQKALLQSWIAEGAEYRPHWAFLSPARPVVPQSKRSGWTRNAVDRFVLAAMDAQGLAPSAEASKETLIRRLSFDLRGLPPEPAEIDAFLADRSSRAFEGLVERFLASPHYGERMALEWLDLARYADTYGYQADVDRDLSPWRDWVIDAFNDNLPYDQFLTWQLAGDLLPKPTREQVLATAFNRLHRQTNEGGSVEEEFRAEYAADRVNTLGSAVLGLTLECARCHDHKYDPVSQRDYYRLFAFFNNIDESGLYSHFTRATPTPTMLLFEGDEERQLEAARKKIRKLERQQEEARRTARKAFARWSQEQPPESAPPLPVGLDLVEPFPIRTPQVGRDSVEPKLDPVAAGSRNARKGKPAEIPPPQAPRNLAIDGSRDARVVQGSTESRPTETRTMGGSTKAHSAWPVTLPAPVAWFRFDEVVSNRTANAVAPGPSLELFDGPESVPGFHGHALRFDGDNSAVAKGVGAFRRTEAFSVSLVLKPTLPQDRAVIFHRSRSWTDSGSRGYQLVIEQGRPHFALVHFWPGNAVSIRARQAVPTNVWSHLTVTYDGSSQASGLAIYLNGERLECETVRNRLVKDIFHRKEWGDADVDGVHFTLAGRFRDSGFKHGAIDDVRVFDVCLTPIEARACAVSVGITDDRDLPSPDEAAWFEHYLRRHDPGFAQLKAELRRAREEENRLVNDIREIMVMREMSTRRSTHLLQRGAYDAPGEAVEPGLPAALAGAAGNRSRLHGDGLAETALNRLDLARWIVDPTNPLTARVLVNRIWKQHFGRGLVDTPSDFGSQGAQPTHPELLDWLATTFVRSGWDVKALHRSIVTSAAYRQGSLATPEQLARDPENRFLARGPKHRLGAEEIRDAALAASGLLVRQLGGPSVKPYQPAGLWEESGTGKSYQQDHGDNLYRRSLYTFWRRTAPPPSMLTFDATSREVCTAKRDTTATPLQALVLLNDPQFVEAARVLAENLVSAHPADLDARIRQACRRVFGREPFARERAILRRLYDEQRALFAARPADAGKSVAVGERPRRENLPTVDVAATAALTLALLNHDEFVM